MDQGTVLTRLKAAITEIVGEEPNPFGPESTLETLGLDSVERVELLVQLEDGFDITIPNADAVHLSSVESLVRYVLQRVQ